ncbi:MAG: LysR family transcriptional regulator [Cyanobacteria bacterium P01_F01_bin.86]
MDIELRQLRYFRVVAEELNFTRAAKRLQIAQPPLSRQIQRLEKELGVTLLQRTQRRVQLTASGQVFLEHCQQILAQVETGILATQRAARGETGRLVIAFEGSFNYELVPLLVKAFCSQFPDVELILQEMSSGEQLQALSSDRLQLGFLIPSMPTDDLEIETLFSEPLVVALAATHPLSRYEQLTLSQLTEEPWITGPSHSSCGLLIHILNVCREAGFEPQIRQRTNEIQMALGFVAMGLGVTLVPASTQHLQPLGVVYRQLEPQIPEVELAMAWRSSQSSPVLNAFLQTAKRMVSESMI